MIIVGALAGAVVGFFVGMGQAFVDDNPFWDVAWVMLVIAGGVFGAVIGAMIGLVLA